MKNTKLFLIVILGITLFTGCTMANSADTRLIKHFNLQNLDKMIDVEKVRLELLQQLPIGSSEIKVYEFLNEAKIGADKLSSYHKSENANITCRIEYDPSTFGFVKESYGIFFIMDEKRGLKDIKVERWLTGL